MAPEDTDERDRQWHRHLPSQTRRRVLRLAAAAGWLPAVGASASAQQDQGTRIVLGGVTAGWEGEAPEGIQGQTNPTLELEDGETYVLEWENVDGQPHNFAILDADGNQLVRTEVISERGATQTVEFDATRAMSEYVCEVHPTTMRGDVSIGPAAEDEEADDAADGEEAEDAEDEQLPAEPGFFQEGAEVGVSHVATGMTAPTDFAIAGDGRVYVADQTGELWVVTADDIRAASGGVDVGDEPAIDLSDRMVAIGESFAGSYADPEQDYDERGLLGVELHPRFVNNGRLFLHYSAPPNEETPDGWSHVEVVSEFRVAADDPLSVAPDSEQVLLEFQKPQYNHDAGPMAFGPDGYLYVPMGDGGGANDDMYGHVDDWYDGNAGGNGQDTTQNHLGGIHRIDVDAQETIRGEQRNYGIPDDNPLVDAEGHLGEYYSWGWRNPFGIAFDSDGRLLVADAGQNLFEEANLVQAGGNYGWNVKEGTHCFSTDDPGQPVAGCPYETPEDVRGGERLLDPVVEYPHNYEGSPVGIVIVGGHVYEAGDIEDLQGKYVFGDWTRDVAREEPDGRLFAAAPGGEGGQFDDVQREDPFGQDQSIPRDALWEMEELTIAGSEDGNLHRFVRQFGRGPAGDVFVLVNERGVPEGDTGAVLVLVPPDQGDEIEVPETDGDGA